MVPASASLPGMSHSITTVTDADLRDLLELMRAYCDFYEVAPSDDELLALSRALIADPQRQGVQLIARGDDGHAIAFATVYWTWQTLDAAPCAVMNDLYVDPDARGTGLAEALIAECRARATAHGAASLVWQTAKANRRAQRLYDRVGGRRSDDWLDYSLGA